MKHYGDITKIKGNEVETVDIITGGSPCQDLSIAGKRAGLSGERSGLFMEQIRIIKEMREKEIQSGKTADDIRPRYMVWEWLAKRMVSQYDRPTEMASLFDGIGGFPVVYSRCGCRPVWASEIEEFGIAVTKYHFGEE